MASARRRLLVGITAAALSAIVVLGLDPAAAWAHVGASATSATGGATSVTFTFTHGCETAPTTSLRVQLPEGTSAVTPADPPGWTSTATGTELSWTGGSIPNGQRGSFTAVMTIPGQAGQTVFLPTIQGCPGGLEEAWLDKSPDPEATNAAPRIVLTTTVAPPSTTAAPTSTTTASTATTAATATSSTAVSTTPVPATGTGTGTGAGGTSAPTASGAAPAPSSSAPLLIGAGLVGVALLGAGGYLLAKRSRSGPG